MVTNHKNKYLNTLKIKYNYWCYVLKNHYVEAMWNFITYKLEK